MSNTTTSGWSTDAEHASLFERVGYLTLKAAGIGVLAGMGAFVYNTPQFLRVSGDGWLLLVPMFAAGVFAYQFANTLQESVRLAVLGFFGGLAVFLVGWVAPLWILPYSKVAIDVMLPAMVGEVLSAAFINYAGTYLGGYLLNVSVAGFWE